MSFRRTSAIAASVALAIALGLPLLSSLETESVPVQVPAEVRAPATAARIVYIDPATGRLTERPTDSRLALVLHEEFVNTLSSHKGVVVETRQDGTIVISRPGGFRSAVMATIDAGGRVHTHHITKDSGRPLDEAEEQEAGDDR